MYSAECTVKKIFISMATINSNCIPIYLFVILISAYNSCLKIDYNQHNLLTLPLCVPIIFFVFFWICTHFGLSLYAIHDS